MTTVNGPSQPGNWCGGASWGTEGCIAWPCWVAAHNLPGRNLLAVVALRVLPAHLVLGAPQVALSRNFSVLRSTAKLIASVLYLGEELSRISLVATPLAVLSI
jgi:hypothetical protein